VTERYRDKTVYGRPPGSGLEGRTSEVCCNIGGGINRRLLSLSCELARAPKARPRAKTGSPVFHCDTQVMSGRASDVKLVQSCGDRLTHTQHAKSVPTLNIRAGTEKRLNGPCGR